ncbi:MAG: hypothetical protein KDD65_13885 [Bacteroidetes bacterium]|nr:hypothetical protein [Bacteroidota bacterium]
MQSSSSAEDQDRIDAELETLQRWYDELADYLEQGLRDPQVSQDEYSNAATMATRVLIRLKTLYDSRR